MYHLRQIGNLLTLAISFRRCLRVGENMLTKNQLRSFCENETVERRGRDYINTKRVERNVDNLLRQCLKLHYDGIRFNVARDNKIILFKSIFFIVDCFIVRMCLCGEAIKNF